MKRKAKRPGQPQPGDRLLSGPAGCMRVHGTRRACDTCHAIPGVLHVPLRARGQFCPTCCPCCNPALRAAGVAGANTAALNWLFQDQGVTRVPGRITAATVRHGERKR
jgi:hypothetical protein